MLCKRSEVRKQDPAMHRHLVTLLEEVVRLAGETQVALRPNDWKCLLRLRVALRKQCEQRGW